MVELVELNLSLIARFVALSNSSPSARIKSAEKQRRSIASVAVIQ